MKLNKYYINSNLDIIKLLPSDTQRVLDIGCYTGEFGRVLKAKRPSIYVVGIEIDKKPSEVARLNLDEVLNVDIEIFSFDLKCQKFDCIVFGDVLEHLKDPTSVLKKSLKTLKENGCVIVSLPNIQHITAIKNLICGIWPQRNRGLFDKTHLRFFTWRSITELARESDLRIVSCHPRFRFIDEPKKINLFALMFKYTPLRRYFIYQYVVKFVLKKS